MDSCHQIGLCHPALHGPDSSWDCRRVLHRIPPNEFDWHDPHGRESHSSRRSPSLINVSLTSRPHRHPHGHGNVSQLLIHSQNQLSSDISSFMNTHALRDNRNHHLSRTTGDVHCSDFSRASSQLKSTHASTHRLSGTALELLHRVLSRFPNDLNSPDTFWDFTRSPAIQVLFNHKRMCARHVDTLFVGIKRIDISRLRIAISVVSQPPFCLGCTHLFHWRLAVVTVCRFPTDSHLNGRVSTVNFQRNCSWKLQSDCIPSVTSRCRHSSCTWIDQLQ